MHRRLLPSSYFTPINTALVFADLRSKHCPAVGLLLLACLAWSFPLLAEVELAGSGNTHLDTAPNGVPLVNIATPNSAGVSQNIYQQFDVDAQGLILNNATDLSQTQLGGWIDANTNLSGGSAGIILNEVVGSRSSLLNGYLEVGGVAADVIVANPYGITCNGCGFINTNRATLTTGEALLNGNGGLSGFSVSQGTIWFEGSGLNATNIDRVDVLARAVALNAELYANTLNLVAGQHTVDYGNLGLSDTRTDGDSPAFVIDSTQLGGIYAGRIRLISSEAGVGVNLQGPVAAITGDLQISANGDLTYKALSSQQNLSLDVNGRVNGEGDAFAGGSLRIKSEQLYNQGLIFSLADLDLSIDTLLENGTTTQNAALMALGDIRINDWDNTNPDLVVKNNGSWMESLAGNIVIHADQLLNQRTGLVIDRKVLDYANAWRVYNQIYYAKYTPFVGNPTPYPFVKWTNGDSLYVAIASQDYLRAQGSPALIKAAGNLDINTRTAVTNDTSYLLADGNISIHTGVFENLTESLYRNYREYHFDYDDRSDGNCSYGKDCKKGDSGWGVLLVNTTTKLGQVNSVVAASGTVSINGTTQVSNGKPDDYLLSNPYADTVSESLNPADPLALLNNPLFNLNQNPGHPYLIETNPLFADYQHFISSSYLLDRLGWVPDDSILMLGDGAFELHWLREQLLNDAGTLYLSADFNDEQSQFQYLMDNAIAAQADLELSPGIALTAEQINNLQKDMVWLVEQEMKGQTVLVPTLYLSHANERMTPEGAIIAAQEIDISAGQIDNAGLLQAENALILNSEAGNITNTGGLMKSEGLLALQAAEDIQNLSGIIEGKMVTLQAEQNIISQTLAQQQHLGNEQTSRYETLVGDTATISGDQLILDAGADILLQAARLRAANAAVLNAGKDIQLSTQALANGHEYLGDNADVQHRVTHLASDLQSGGDLMLNAGNNLLGVGVQLEAGGDLGLYAEQDMAFVSAIDSDYHFSQKTEDKAYGEKTTTTENYHEAAVASRFTAGGKLLINTVIDPASGELLTTGAQGDVLLAGVETLSGQDTVIYAGRDLQITATETQQFSHSETHRDYNDLALGAGTLVGVQTLGLVDVEVKVGEAEGQVDSELHRSEMIAGGDTVLLSGRHTTLVAADLLLDNLIAEAGLNSELGEGHIAVLGAHESHSQYQSETSLDLGPNIDGGRLTLAEYTDTAHSESQQNYQGSNVLAFNNLDLSASGDATLVGSTLNGGLSEGAEGHLNISAGGQVRLLSASDIHEQSQATTTRTLLIETDASGSEASLFAGYEEIRTKNETAFSTVVGSQLSSTIIDINSGSDINMVGAALQANDINLQAVGDINTESAVNQEEWNSSLETLRVGIQVSARETYTNAENAINNYQDAEGGLNKTFSALQAIDAISTFRTSPITASADLVAEYSRSETEQSNLFYTPTVLVANNDIHLQSGGNQHHQGTQVYAGNNLSINAEGEIIIESVENQFQNKNSSKNLSASMSLPVSQSFSAAAGYSNDRQTQNQNLNAYFEAGQNLSLSSAGDTTLAGAIASGENIQADIGGDLHLISRQDTSSSRGEGANVSFSTSGEDSKGFGVGGYHAEGDSKWVTQQTGLYARDQLDIDVENHTELLGSVIASDTGNLSLDTQTLSFADLHDSDRYNSTQLNAGFQTSQGAAVESAQNGSGRETAAKESNLGGPSVNSISGNYQSRDLEQITRATIGEGQITVRGDRVGENSLAGLNRDLEEAQRITKDEEENDQLYLTDSSISTLTDRDKRAYFFDFKHVFEDVAGNVMVGLDEIDNSLLAFATLGQAEGEGLISEAQTLKLQEAGAEFGGESFELLGSIPQRIAMLVPSEEEEGLLGEIGGVLNALGVAGIIPSDKNDGGLLAQIPGFFGVRDLKQDLYLVKEIPEEWAELETLPDGYVRAENLEDFDKLAYQGQKETGNMMVKVTEATEETTYQHTVNGMLNNLPQAIVNAKEQTKDDNQNEAHEFTLIYNPSHGFVPDLLEASWDVVFGSLSMFNTGASEFVGETQLEISKTRVNLKKETNFANHSQGNILTMAGLLSQQSSDFAFLAELPDEIKHLVPQYGSYGSPVNSEKMNKTIVSLDMTYSGSMANEGDFIAIVLGGNKGENEQASFQERFDAIGTWKDLFKPKYEIDANGNRQDVSPHSRYACEFNCGIK